MKLYLKTFGCQMNVHDSSRISEMLGQRSYELTDDPRQADLGRIWRLLRSYAYRAASGVVANSSARTSTAHVSTVVHAPHRHPRTPRTTATMSRKA